MKGKNHIYYRNLLLSYILVLIIPMFVILFYFVPVQQKMQKQKIMEDLLLSLQQERNTIDQKLSRVYTLAVEFYDNEKLRPYFMQGGAYNEFMVQKEIDKLIKFDQLIYIAGIYYVKTDRLYTNNFVTSLDNFGEGYHSYEYWDSDELREVISNQSLGNYLHPEDGFQLDVTSMSGTISVITFIFPYPSANARIGTLIVLIRNDFVVKSLWQRIQSLNGSVIIYSQTNGVVASYGENAQVISESEVFNQIVSTDTEETIDVNIDGEQILLCCVPSEENDWIYVFAVPFDTVIKPYRTSLKTMVLLIILLISLEMAAVFILHRTNYKPIHKIINLISNQTINKIQKKHIHMNARTNEMDTIYGALVDMRKTTERITTQLEANYPVIRNFLLQGLLKGQYNTLEEFNFICEPYGLTLINKYYVIAVINVITDENYIFNDPIYIEEDNKYNLKAYFIYGITKNSFIYLFGIDSPNDNCYLFLLNMINKIRESILNNTGFECVSGLGNFVASINEIPLSYHQALYTIDYLLLHRNNPVMTYNNYINNICKEGYVNALFTMNMYIAQRNIRAFIETINKICTQLLDPALPPQIVLILYTDSIRTISKSIIRYDQDYENILLGDEIVGLKNLNKNSIQEYCENIRILSEDLIKYMQSDNEFSENKIVRNILSFINDNYLRYDFSSKMVAQHFGLSQPELSKMVKRCTGLNFSEHVNIFRINYANKLLVESELSIQEISEKLGYTNESSFGRAYKRVSGISPGTYRIQEKKHK